MARWLPIFIGTAPSHLPLLPPPGSHPSQRSQLPPVYVSAIRGRKAFAAGGSHQSQETRRQSIGQARAHRSANTLPTAPTVSHTIAHDVQYSATNSTSTSNPFRRVTSTVLRPNSSKPDRLSNISSMQTSSSSSSSLAASSSRAAATSTRARRRRLFLSSAPKNRPRWLT